METAMQMQATNLFLALDLAVTEQRRREKLFGYHSDSALVQGWVEVQEAIKQGQPIEVKPYAHTSNQT